MMKLVKYCKYEIVKMPGIPLVSAHSSETYINLELLGNIGNKEEGVETIIINEDSEKYALISSFFQLP